MMLLNTQSKLGVEKAQSNGIMGVWGEFVSVDYDICVA